MNIVDKQTAAKALNVSRPTLDKLISQGLPLLSGWSANRKCGCRIDLDAARAWLESRQAAQKAERDERRGDIHDRIYEAVRTEFWNLARPLLRPDDLRLVRDGCRDTEQLIETSRRLSKNMHRRLVQLADDLWIQEHPQDA
jgi:phage terminase Nu1 subunit (DNA packaging protein)